MIPKQIQKSWPYYYALVPIGLILLGTSAWSWWRWASAPVTQEATAQLHLVKIPPGTATDEVGEKLVQSGVIRSRMAWRLWNRYLLARDQAGGVKAGTYALSASQSLEQIAVKLWQGDVVQRSFTVPEGWNLRKMAAAFQEQGYFSADAFIQAVQQIPYAEHPWLPADLPHLEGFLYPDTYSLDQDQITPERVIDQMLKRFEEVALPLYRQSQSQLSLKDWVTLGSIVEKESVIEQERPIIAGVFLRRLKLGIALGSDPTVEYGLNIQQTADRPLTYKEVGTPSPYNTYKNAGLPPTAIASPGIGSLKAVLEPETTPYLYFMARYDGSHIFSRTLAEHESAQRLVRQLREAQGRT